MLLYLLIVAAVNLAVGYGLAIVLGRAPAEAGHATSGSFAAMKAIAPPLQASMLVENPAAPTPRSIEELPAEWKATLEEVGEVRSFVEGSVHVLRADVGRYRQRLIEVDGLLRRCLREPRQELLIMCLGEVQQANEDWLRTQGEARSALRARRDQFGDLAALGGSLEELLTEQAALIESTSSDLATFDPASDVPSGAAHLLGEVCKLLDLCHRLRDRTHDSLVGILQREQRLMSLDADRLIDRATGIHNRLGLERVLAQWSSDPDACRRPASFALVDVDRLGRINEQHGPLVGDRVIAHVGRLVSETVRRDRGFDVVARLAGQIVAIFLGDTEPHSAAAALERVRQTIQSHQFLLAGEEVEVRVTCGVIEVAQHDISPVLCYRAAQTLREAKRAGRNLTLVQTSTGATVTEPPPCHVASGTIRLDEDEKRASR